MIIGPDDFIHWLYLKIGKYTGKLHPEPNLEPPLLNKRSYPFMEPDIIQPQKTSRTTTNLMQEVQSNEEGTAKSSVALNINQLTSSSIKDLRASDYVTPQKYLDGAEIPSYYSFQSNMLPPEDWVHGMHPFLDVDRRLTLPTRTHIRFLVTATDVLHSWAVPSLNVKVDALPGRVTRMNTFILREGVFYGQCSEMCGSLHGYMPIVVEAVSPEAYAAHARKFYRE